MADNPPSFQPPRRRRPDGEGEDPPAIVVGRQAPKRPDGTRRPDAPQRPPAPRRESAARGEAPPRIAPGGARTPAPARPERPATGGAPAGGTPSGTRRGAPPATVPPRRPPATGTGGGGVRPAPQGTAGRGAVAGGRGPGGPGTAPRRPAAAPAPRRRGRLRRRLAVGLVLVLALLVAWPVGLAMWADGRLERVDALSGAEGTPGTTYLLAGSDARDGDVVRQDSAEGSRTDTIMLLHVPSSGPSALLSLPRDTFVEIPGHGPGKLNAAYSYGGAPLLVETVEDLTGLTVDHYVEVGFAGVAGVVDALDGVELCLDQDVNDKKSHLRWKAGCHVSDGKTAIAFARMRYADAEGDIGRGGRQQQLIKAVTKDAVTPGVLVNPAQQVRLVRTGTDALTVSEGSGVVDLGRLALGFRSATGDGGVTGTPWITNPDYRPGGVGSTVLLDDARNAELFASLLDGSVKPGKVGGMPKS